MGKIQQSRLVELESVVESGLSTFVEVGTALAEINESKLYKATHGTFKTYCEERWGISRSWGYRLMAAKKQAEMSPVGDKIENEHQARTSRQSNGPVRKGADVLFTPPTEPVTEPTPMPMNMAPVQTKSSTTVTMFAVCPQCGYTADKKSKKRGKACPHEHTVYRLGRKLCEDCGDFV